LPFLQKTLPDCKIVPIMVGSQDWQNCELLGNAIAHTFRSEEILIIASSDLYHGYSYKECVATDQFTIQAIEKFEPRQLARALHENKAQACGGGAIVAGQWAAAQLGGKRVVTLKYANSNDITNTREGYVVGYVAAMILNPSSYEK
ncbi:MAG: AmmeMemoRadiSam system protein B, partial [candidate division WOR-3 bacterium]